MKLENLTIEEVRLRDTVNEYGGCLVLTVEYEPGTGTRYINIEADGESSFALDLTDVDQLIYWLEQCKSKLRKEVGIYIKGRQDGAR